MTESRAEFTLRAVMLGSFLGIVFGLVTVYVALEVGLNFSASVPIAVLSITLFKRLGKQSTLEKNIVQTVGSAGESIAAGVVYTMPALLFLGYRLELWRIFWLALIGGLLGVLFMIPLREYLVVKEHGKLPYPEGTACAEILISGEKGGRFARLVFVGLSVGGLYKLLMSGFRLWPSAVSWSTNAMRGAVLSMDLAPELLGIGALIGLPVARVIVAGSVMSGIVLIPLIYFFGEQMPAAIYPSQVAIGSMSPGDIWSSYIRYVGAGAVIAGGALLLVDTLPTVISSVASGVRSARAAASKSVAHVIARTEQDLPITIVGAGSVLMLACLYVLLAWKINPQGSANGVSVALVAVFGFFFVAVSARITGLMGSSANPISGITIAVVMLTCLLFVSAGWTGATYEVIAVSIGAVVCVAASNAGTTAQDLKTGFLLGATPRLQQLGLVIGVLTSVLVIGFTLMWLNGSAGTPVAVAPAPLPSSSRLMDTGAVVHDRRYDVYSVAAGNAFAPGRYYVSRDNGLLAYREPQRIGSMELPAPQAQVMAILVEGLLTHRMRWRLLLAGAVVALVLELCGVRSLPFAVGMYLPLSATSTLLLGALIGHFAKPKAKSVEGNPEDPFEPGVLYSSGLIAGGAIAAIAVAVASSFGLLDRFDLSKQLAAPLTRSPAWAILVFSGLCALLWRYSRREESSGA
jgi:putative OPT family oligopeptide transporter